MRTLLSALSTFALTLAIGIVCLAAEKPPLYPDHQDLLYYLDAKGSKHPISKPADWEKRREHILANMQRAMGPVPDVNSKVPLQPVTLESASVDGISRQKIKYQTEAGDVVHAFLFVPHIRPGEKRAAILCLHQTIEIGKEEPAGLGGSPNLHYALHLAKRGYVTLAPDYPSFGQHKYDFKSAASQARYQSGSMKAIWDNQRALDFLQTIPQVDKDRIGCIGHSLGGHNTLFTAAFDPRIKVLVSSCGFTRFPRYYGGKLKGWTSDRYMPKIDREYGNDPNRVPFDFTEIIASLAPRPFLASSPVGDGNFDVTGVRETIAAAKPVYALYGKADNLQANYPNCGHDFPEDARKVAYEFFDRHLQHTPIK